MLQVLQTVYVNFNLFRASQRHICADSTVIKTLTSFDITLTIETAGRSLGERQTWRDWRGMLPKCIDPIAPTFRPGWSLWTLSLWIENSWQTEHMHGSRPFLGAWDILQHIDSRRLSFCWLRIPIDHHKLSFCQVCPVVPLVQRVLLLHRPTMLVALQWMGHIKQRQRKNQSR